MADSRLIWILAAACSAAPTAHPAPPRPATPIDAAPADTTAIDHVREAYRAMTIETIDPAPAKALAALAWPAGTGFGDDAAANAKLLATAPIAAGDEWAAIEAMAASRDSVHVALLDAAAAQNLGAFVSGGAALAPGFRAHRAADGSVVIDAVVPDGPAAAAGIAAGDVLVSIDGAPPARVIALPFFLHPDHTYALVLDRAGAPISATLALTAHVEPVLETRLVRRVAVVQLHAITGDAAAQLTAAIAQLDPRSLRGLVLDLRGNLGGEDPIPVISMFSDADPVLAAVDLAGAKQPWAREGTRVTWPHAVAVLVDEQTASSAEMIAYALGRLGDARVFGEPTSGALSVPATIALDDHVLMVPTARVVDPIDGKPSQGDRVHPDVVIAGATAAQVVAGDDPQLDRAIDWFKK